MRIVPALVAAAVALAFTAGGAAAAPPPSDNTATKTIKRSTPQGSFKHKDLGVDLKDCAKCHKKDAKGKVTK